MQTRGHRDGEKFRLREEVVWRIDQTAMSVLMRTDWEYSAFILAIIPLTFPAEHPSSDPQFKISHSTCGLTSNIKPRRNTIATQETISAWFWMTNSWLSTGGFLLVFFRIPMSTRFVQLLLHCSRVFSLLLPDSKISLCSKLPPVSYMQRARQQLNGVSLFH